MVGDVYPVLVCSLAQWSAHINHSRRMAEPRDNTLKKSLRALVENSVNPGHGAFFSQLKHNVDQTRATHYSPTKERGEHPHESGRRNDKQLLVAKLQRQSRETERLEATVRRLHAENALLQQEAALLRRQLAERHSAEAAEQAVRVDTDALPKPDADAAHVIAQYKTALSISRHQCAELKRRLEASSAANRFQQRVLEQLQGIPALYGAAVGAGLRQPGELLGGLPGELLGGLAAPQTGGHQPVGGVDLAVPPGDRDFGLRPDGVARPLDLSSGPECAPERLPALPTVAQVHLELHNYEDPDSTTRLLSGEPDGTTAMLLRGSLSDPYDMFRHQLLPGAKLRAAVIALRFIARMRALVARTHAWRQQVHV